MVLSDSAPGKEMPPKLAKVPPFPAVALKLLSILSNENAGFASIVACIATDPVLSAKMIHRANAADMATYCEAASVHQAVVALGTDRTREVSLTVATASYASTALKKESLRGCWYHSLASALIASELARQCGSRPVEPYTAGLLHDIGRLGLLTAYPEQYEQILAAAAEQPVDVMELERMQFGVDHVEAGAWLAREWRLPEAVVEAIVRQNEPPAGVLNDVTLVQVACQLADLLGLSAQKCHSAGSFDEIAAPLPEWTRQRVAAQLPAIKAAILKEIAPSESEENPQAKDLEGEDAPAVAEEAPGEIPASRGFGGLVGVVATIAVLLLVAAVLFMRH
jgi:putative nucleotidyltransferase with HDIG domain